MNSKLSFKNSKFVISHLMSFLDHFGHLVVADSVHVLHLLQRLYRLHSDEGLAERHWSEARVEVKQAGVQVDPQEAGDVHVVGQRCGQAYDADHLLRALDLAQGPRYEGLHDRAPVAVQKVHLVDDQEFHQVGKRDITCTKKI